MFWTTVDSPIDPLLLIGDETGLRELQIAHLVSVPFENIDVFRRTGVTTDLDWSLPKVVDRRRGGWCFELNGAFGWLLGELGYTVDYVSCQVFGGEEWGPPLDHCALVVHADGERWFVDVGFGDCCMVPVPMVDGEHDAVPRDVRFTIDSDGFRMEERDLDGTWNNRLQGTFEPRSLADFTPRKTPVLDNVFPARYDVDHQEAGLCGVAG